LHQRVFERLDGTRDVTLDEEVERLDLALFKRTREVFKADPLACLRQLCVAFDSFPLLSDLARGAVFLGDKEGVSCAGNGRETLNLDGPGRRRLKYGLAVLVHHGANSAIGRSS